MRKIIKKLHLYLALILCLPLVLQGLSGSILVIERKISEPKKAIFAEQIDEVSKIIATAQKEVPQGFTANFVKINEATTVRFSQKTAEKNLVTEVLVDPISLKVLEQKDPQMGFFNFIKKFHTNLLIQGPVGRNIIGSYGLVMLFMIISGLILWYPRKGNWKQVLTFKFSSTGKKFHRDLHSAVGFWTVSFLFISSFSGVYLAFPQATGKFITSVFDGEVFAAANAIKVVPNEKKPLAIDDAIKMAKAEADDGSSLYSISLPTKPDQPYRINFSPKNYENGEPLITIFVDQWQKKIIEKRDPENYKSGEKIMAWQHTLHVGEGLGLAWTIAVFFVGFLPLLFSITGILLWWIKRKAKIAAAG